jgi:phosphate starvation-inducible PhoH-like protein
VQVLAGEFGSHLRIVERVLGVGLRQRGTTFRIVGEVGRVDAAAKALTDLYALVERGHPLRAADVHTALRVVRDDPTSEVSAYVDDTVLGGGERSVSPRSPGQKAYAQALRNHAVVFGVGPAGTGKTYLAMAAAVSALLGGQVRRIIMTRPAVEAGEKLGFLPGDLAEKVDPYLRPLQDALHDMLPLERVGKLMERRQIEVAPLAFMRGRTLNDAFVVLDEAQNTTVEQMKMFLTRLGANSRMVVTGDPTQVDLPRGHRSGLADALEILDGVEGVAVVRLGTGDIVRHPLVARIVAAYETRDRSRE